MKSAPAAPFAVLLTFFFLGLSADASARSAGVGLHGARAARAFAPAGNQCLGATCGLAGRVPVVTARPFVRPQARFFRRYHRHAFRRDSASYGGLAYGGVGYGDYPLAAPPYVGSVPEAVTPEPRPRGCYAQPYSVPSEGKGMATVVVTRCFGI